VIMPTAPTCCVASGEGTPEWLICALCEADALALRAANNRRYAPNVRLSRPAGCSLCVTANVHAKGRRPLVLTGDIFMKPSLPTPGVRQAGRRMDVPRHEHAVERSSADVPDNRPLSGDRVTVPAYGRRAVSVRLWGPRLSGSRPSSARTRYGGSSASLMPEAEDRLPFRQLLALQGVWRHDAR
jgi:hypothetical protein